jgi:hypothetical protein
LTGINSRAQNAVVSRGASMTIRINKIDEEKSKPSDSQPQYVANLSDKLDQTRINNLESLVQKSRNPDIMNIRVELRPGNVLTFDTKGNVDLDVAVATINGWLEKISGEEAQFKQNIADVNEKLASRKDLNSP